MGLPTLYYVDFSDTGDIFDLGVGIEEYIAKGIDAFFFYGWQKAFFLSDEEAKDRIACCVPNLFLSN